MVMLAAFDVLLCRYSGQADIVVGTPVAGRDRTELEALIGLFINTVALRADLSGDPSFISLLEQLRRVTLDAQANQGLPFERLVEALQPDRTLSHAPVFQVMFNLTPIPECRRSAHELKMSMGRLLDHGVATFDLTLSVGERADGLDLIFEYDRDLFRRESIDRLADHYEQLLTAILGGADRRIGELPMLTADETRMLCLDWNPEVIATPEQRSESLPVHRLFEAHADAAPDAPALIAGDQRVTYSQLDRRANRFAHHLRSLGVGPEIVVGLCIDRSVEMLVGILGIHKAGGAYVPLDPDYPPGRLAEMITNAAPPVLVAHSSVASRLPSIDIPIIWLDSDADTLAALPTTRPAVEITPDHLAYVLFTSGSTGRAKGVMVTHANLSSVGNAWQAEYDLGGHDRHLQMASFSFDVFTGDWVRALGSGGSLVLCPRMTLLEPARLYALMRDAQITCAEFVPAVMRLLMTYLADSGKDLSFMRLVMVGSDVWFGTEYRRLSQLCGSDVRLVNSYGTAETTIDSTWFEANSNESYELLNDGPVPIGRPFDNSRVYLCDAQLRLVPIGVAGEICIGGAGVARGYLNDPQLTAERFVADPFGGDRLYRTGDRARYLSDGTIQFLGRVDQQVKLRGFRVELGEIEAVLAAHPALAASAVVLFDPPPGGSAGADPRLVAYVVTADAMVENATVRAVRVDDTMIDDRSDEPVDATALRAYLKTRLPDYMVPARFVRLDSLPLTPNGKLDRGSLPAPEWRHDSEGARVAPRNAVESALCGLFGEVLGVSATGIHDDFFDLGGHSLLATQLVSRIRDALDVELPLRLLFDAPSPADLAIAMAQGKPGVAVPFRSGKRSADIVIPASYAQQRLWFLARLEPDSAAYHLHWSVRLHGELDVEALRRAVTALVQRHEVLRTTFSSRDGFPVQCVHDDLEVPVVIETASDVSDVALAAMAAELISQPFDLANGPLLTVNVLCVSAHEHVLLLVIHHIVADGWSMSVLFRELATAYNAYRRGESPQWATLPAQYADYALWQREWLAGDELSRQCNYWRAELDGMPPLLTLPTDRPRPTIQTHRGAWVHRHLSETLCKNLLTLAREQGCTLFMVLLAAFDVVLGRYAGQEDIVVGTPIAGRGRTELEGLIGFFINTLVLRTDLGGNPRFSELLARVKQTALGAYAHQDLPFEKLVELLNPERNRSYSPIVQTLFTVHNQPVQSFALDDLESEAQHINNSAAKFDLSLHVSESDASGEDRGMTLAFAYNADLFDERTIIELASYYEAVLATVAEAAELRIGELPLAAARPLPAPPVVPRVADFTNDWDAGAPAGSLVERFMVQVRRDPKRLAVQTARFSWSYGALNERSNRVAQRLLLRQVGARQVGAASGTGVPETGRIGLMCRSDAPLLAGLMGILKSGQAYVPLDPELPAARLEELLVGARLAAVVADTASVERARQLVADGVMHGVTAELPVIDIEAPDDQELDAAFAISDPAVTIDPDALAYILYTSGTTGTPKGVMQSHRGVLQQIATYTASLRLQRDDRLSGLSGYGFDAAVQDIFGALLNGATVYPLAAHAAASGGELLTALLAAGVTVLHATPTMYRHLLGGELNCGHDLSGIRLVVLGGETVRRSDFELFKARFARGTVFVNGLGLTESTLALQFFADHDTKLPGQVVPVGAAVAGVEIELLDASGAAGWYGEITIRGPGVALGYWGQTALTQAHFETDGQNRVYRSGDIGRRLPDGRIVYVGRRDDQVKVRGYRIELGEIEAVLSGYAGVAGCAVTVDGRVSGDERLVAYVVASGAAALSASALRAHLAARLPGYMLPQGIETLPALPRLGNGKVDRQRLPQPRWGRDAEQAYVPARTELEAVLTDIWRDVLKLEQVGVHDDFFALGGHSLLATRLISRVRDRLAIEVPLFSVFESPTVAGLADTIEHSAIRSADAFPALGRRIRGPVTEQTL